MTPGRRRAFRDRLVRWFKNNARPLPWRQTHDPYAILVSEFMLQQTQVATVLGYYTRWLRRFPDWSTLASAHEQEVLSQWQGLGYYSRARNLHAAAQIVCSDHGGRLPHDAHAIRALPGVGLYTSGAVCTFAFDLPEPAVDVNAERVLARVAGYASPVDCAAGKKHLHALALALQPMSGAGAFNAALMELGALVCTQANPKCSVCPVQGFCAAHRMGEPDVLPIKSARPAITQLIENRALVHHRGRFLLQQEKGTRWRGLWRMPDGSSSQQLLCIHRYSITRYRITMHVRASQIVPAQSEDLRWFSLRDISTLPMPSPHRTALGKALAASDAATSNNA